MMASALAAASHLITGATVQWQCDPHTDTQRIYFGNHSSHLDFIVIWSSLPPRLRRLARPVAGRDYWGRGLVRRYLVRNVFHAVLIDRKKAGANVTAEEEREAARRSIEHMAREMENTYSLIVFPEGTRSMDGVVGPFKSGLYHLACTRPDVELVPVHLQNLNRILPKGEILPVPMLSRVVFGAPLHVAPGEQKQDFLNRARSALIQLGAES